MDGDRSSSGDEIDNLRQRVAAAEETAKARLDLLATVCHELRNPLHAVQGLAELLAADSELPPRSAEIAAILARQLSGLSTVTQDLLDAARFEVGEVELILGPTDLRAIVDDVAEYGRTMIDTRPVVVDSRVSPTVPLWIESDSARLRQLLRNVVGNAAKFTTDGSISIHVSTVDESSLVLEVSDTGEGIPETEIEHVIKPFCTASTAGRGKGAGMGLAIVHRLAERLGGCVDLASTIEVGTTLRVVLPMQASDGPQLATQGDIADGTRVLVVDDNVINLRLAARQLERLGVQSEEVSSGEAALELLASGELFDVILMDFHMEGIDGWETARRIRELEATGHRSRIVAVTGRSSPSGEQQSKSAMFDDAVYKPVALDDLAAALHRVAPALPAAPDMSQSGSAVEVAALERLVADLVERPLVEQLVDLFLAELPARRQAIVHSRRRLDVDLTRRAAHVLRSTSMLLGAKRLSDLCAQVEELGTPLPDGLDAEIEAVSGELLRWRSSRGELRPVGSAT